MVVEYEVVAGATGSIMIHPIGSARETHVGSRSRGKEIAALDHRGSMAQVQLRRRVFRTFPIAVIIK